MKRLAIAIGCGIVVVSAMAYATPVDAQTMTNEATRKVNADKVLAGAPSCKTCDLFQADFSYKELIARDFTGTRLRQADFSLGAFDRSKFVNANLSVAEGYGARFANADFTGADLTEASFTGAWFGGAQMKNAKLSGANFSGAYLKTAKGLTQDQLKGACGDADTELPAGLTLPACKG